jgi:hypothetical protein
MGEQSLCHDRLGSYQLPEGVPRQGRDDAIRPRLDARRSGSLVDRGVLAEHFATTEKLTAFPASE